jgi:8-oxo-dGTP diphosphatase
LSYLSLDLFPGHIPDALSEFHPLMLDHTQIVQKALETLRDNISRNLVGGKLPPARFTMKELQQVYEAILGEKLHRGTFQRKMLSLGVLQRHEKQYSGAANKAPFLYSFG